MKVQGMTRSISFAISHATQTKDQSDADTEMPPKEKPDNKVDDNNQYIQFLEVPLHRSGSPRLE